MLMAGKVGAGFYGSGERSGSVRGSGLAGSETKLEF